MGEAFKLMCSESAQSQPDPHHYVLGIHIAVLVVFRNSSPPGANLQFFSSMTVMAFEKARMAFSNARMAFEKTILAFEIAILAFVKAIMAFSKAIMAFWKGHCSDSVK